MSKFQRPSSGRRAKYVLAIPTVLVALAGCTSYEQSQSQLEQAIRNSRRSSVRVDTTAVVAASNPDVPTTGIAQARSTIPRQQVDPYIREALARNPGIQAAIANARAQLARIPQVTSLPDPVLRAAVRPEPIQTAAGDVYFTLGVSQTFPLLAKLERAGNIAAAQTRVALEELNSKRVQLVADVERAYWQTYRLDRYLEINRQNREILEDLENVVKAQYEVGAVAQLDLLRVQTELAQLRDEAYRLQVQRAASAAAINQLADYPSDRDIPTTQTVDVPAVNTNVNELIALAAEHNPELAALRERVSADEQKVELAKLGNWPDLTLGFEWNYLDGREPFVPPINPTTLKRPRYSRKSDVGDDNWAITLQINLPIWLDRIDAAKREAQQRLLATQKQQHATENMITFRVYEAWSRVDAQQHTLHVLDNELIPQARQNYEVALTTYQIGNSDFTTLIDHWRRWLDFEQMRHRETVDLELAFSDLQREIGLQLLTDAAPVVNEGDRP